MVTRNIKQGSGHHNIHIAICATPEGCISIAQIYLKFERDLYKSSASWRGGNKGRSMEQKHGAGALRSRSRRAGAGAGAIRIKAGAGVIRTEALILLYNVAHVISSSCNSC